MKGKRFTEEQIIGVLKEAETGLPQPDLLRKHGISQGTFYRWKAKYGGLDVSEARRLKSLEDENRRLKRLVATDKGRACHEQIEACIAQFEDDLQAGIDPQQVAAARAVLELTLKNAQHILEEGNITQERGNTTC